MHHRVDPGHSCCDRWSIAKVSDDSLGMRRSIRGPYPLGVNLLDEPIQCDNLMAGIDEFVHHVRADEPGCACDEYPHDRCPIIRSVCLSNPMWSALPLFVDTALLCHLG